MPRRVVQPVDVYVGSKIRGRRKELGLSQSDLGASIGTTFQQLQKYERGSNRVGSSRLVMIAKALKVPIGYFFPDDDTKMPKTEKLTGRVADIEARLVAILKEVRSLRKLV